MSLRLRGRAAFVFHEANFDVDRILGFEAMRAHDPQRMRAALMSEFDADFAASVRPGDLLIGGANFGYGHPHGPPMAMMRDLGVAGVIAHSFAPLYLMGELAAGFPQIACPGVLDLVRRWDDIHVDLEGGFLANLTTGRMAPIQAPGAHAMRLMESGGLFSLLRQAAAGD